MKKIVRLTESDLIRIVKRVLNEDTKEYMNTPKAGCETYKKGCDPYRYLKVVDGTNIKYYFKKDQDQTWTQAKNSDAILAIQNSIKFNANPETQPKLNSQPVSQDKFKVSGNKMDIDNNKIINGTYKPKELISIVNGWKPSYDFNLKGNTENDRKSDDWKKNVDKKNNIIYDWRNKMINKIESNPNLTPNKKKDATDNIVYLTQLTANKLEKDYQERWKGVT
jgi:hypothetical protein